ncbi:hypothetical protein N0V82_000279 [Gnomoniopsis sp. IMI 355080]|nr:hypothetical protein N0V82_000279 [Gnomoniopsis sp. IMI 355080]
METSSLATPRSGGRSRFSKALPAPPPQDEFPGGQVIRPVRKESLPSRQTRPALPPKDALAASVPSNMATKVMDAPLPALPSLTRVNSPPTVIPRRKPVGSGASVKSAKSPPPPQPVLSGDISPVDSISSLLSAYGTEDSGGRFSVDTAATKHSFAEPSPPKIPPKESLGTGTDRLDIVSPLSLPTPLSSSSSRMMEPAREQQEQYGASPPLQQQYDHPPSPPVKDNRLDTSVSPPSSASNQSPAKPQIWRRRSLKSDKPLTVPELKLSVSHGSTASPQQVTSSVNNELPALPQGNGSMMGTEAEGSHASNGSETLSGHRIRPSPSQKSLPRKPTPENMGNKKSKESLDGFSRYAQELEQGRSTGGFKTPQYSPAKLSPDVHRPPTPEYGQDEAQADGTAIYSPASPMTPPDETRLVVQGDDTRPLSIIREDPDHIEHTQSAAAAPPAGTFAGLPVRTSSRPGNDTGASPRQPGLPRSPRPTGESSNVTASPNAAANSLAPAATITAAASTTTSHARSTSSISVPTISVSDDGDAPTIRASDSPLPAPAMSQSQQPKAIFHEQPASPTSPTSARPGDPGYFPMRHYLARPIAPGTVLAAPPIKPTQLECFAGHYRFVASRNEEHPLACQTCSIKDNGVRYACAHCAVRVCKDCCDVLMMNGRNVGQLVEMLRS